MTASYPTSIKSFTTKVDYVTPISAAHVNDLQDEVVALEALNTGWWPAGETWTRTGATTFTVPTDLTVKYQKGTKIKLTDTTTKYFYVVSSSYGAPNTTVTVTGGIDYSLVSTLSNPYYSYMENPQGFPDWLAWTVVAAPGTGAWTTWSATGKFKVVGNACFYRIDIIITTNGTGGASTNVTPPIPIAGTGYGCGRENGVTGDMLLARAIAGSVISITRYNASYAGGNGYTNDVSGIYEI
jgi:hypothetical protein